MCFFVVCWAFVVFLLWFGVCCLVVSCLVCGLVFGLILLLSFLRAACWFVFSLVVRYFVF